MYLDSMVGVTTDGGFAEYCIVDSRSTAAIPDTMSSEQVGSVLIDRLCPSLWHTSVSAGGTAHVRWSHHLHCHQEGREARLEGGWRE